MSVLVATSDYGFMDSWIPDYFIKSLRLDARSLLMDQRGVQAAVNARGYS